MKNTFERIIQETELGKLVFTYVYKNRRNGDSFIIYRDSNSHLQVVLEKDIEQMPDNAIGVIDNGQFLPL